MIAKVLSAIGFLVSTGAVCAESRDPPPYQRGENVEGTLVSVGSDTMGPLLNSWSTLFRRLHQNVSFKIESRGSGTAIEPLVAGRSQLAPMSREMNAGEVATFEARYDHQPIGFRVALDAVAVYVHGQNPISGLTLEQLDGIFSADQQCGGKRITQWNEVVERWRDDRIMIVGRNKLSGTHDFFRSHALCDGDFAPEYDDEPDSNSVVWTVATTPNSIGYAGVGYLNAQVNAVPLARTNAGTFVPFFVKNEKSVGDPWRLYANVTSGRYPLSRFLFIYVNKGPRQRLPPPVEEFLRFVLSRDGQQAVKHVGLIPIDEEVAEVQRSKLAAGYSKRWWLND